MTQIDFSRFSKVQDSLKMRLMAQYDARHRSNSIGISRGMLLSDDELDMVAAAGKPEADPDENKIN